MRTSQSDAIRSALDTDYVLEAVQENFEPEDVFKEEQLETWAENNGWTKKVE